jgi:hypothetical protein
MYTTITDETEVEEHVVNNAVNENQEVALTEILLDNQANISIVHPALLTNVRKSKKIIRVKGVGGVQLVVDQIGMLEGFFTVYACEHTKANVLSFADVEDIYRITYQRKQAFVVHMGIRDLIFKRRQKLYVADWSVVATVAVTVRENEQLYTKDEVRRAKLAHDFVRNSGYPSLGEAVHILTDGNVRNIPEIRPGDVERAYKIYGLHPEYVRRQLVRKTVSRTAVDHTLRHADKSLKLYADVMHVDGERFLVSVTDPLNLTLQSLVENESRNALGIGLQSHLATLRSRDYEPRIVYVDPHSSFRTMTQDFPGVEIDIGGSGDYVAKVDAKIRRIKETYRKVKHGLPWKLPKVLVRDLVGYAVSRLNIRRTQALSDNVCPRVLFTGVPVPYKELAVAFGDYVEAYEGTTNTSGARSAACIALCPAGNASGSWALWKIGTRVRVRRTNFKKLVTTELVINMMNALAEENESEAVHPLVSDIITQQPAAETDPGENPGASPV